MYLARDLELGIFRAVKELPASSRREAGLLRLLEHPYLPKMIDYTERGNFCYIIMEYIHGRSLEEYMQEGYVFSIEEILCIGDVTLQVLEYFHSRKPAVFLWGSEAGKYNDDRSETPLSGRFWKCGFFI